MSASALLGLSPRVRGSHDHVHHVTHEAGSIPACAGEPSSLPHVDNVAMLAGLSPRVRGSPQAPCIFSDGHGMPVYPRVCGGACWSSF